MTDKEKLKLIRKVLGEVIKYPYPGNSRRDSKGYPIEFIYDKFAYNRMVKSYRTALRYILEKYK